MRDILSTCHPTGGLFTRVSTLNYFDEAGRLASTATVRQEFLGLDAESKELIVNTEVNGQLPSIDPEAQVVFKDYKQEYTKYGPGASALLSFPLSILSVCALLDSLLPLFTR